MNYNPNKLDKCWMNTRGYNNFSHDGILSSDVDNYFNSNVKIMFLLKEAPVGAYNYVDDGGMMIRGINVNSSSRGNCSTFWKKIGMWTYIINSLAHRNYPNIEEFYNEHNDNGYGLANVACVNIKKGNGCSRSNWSDLRKYAKSDRQFLNEQINMIDPNVIVCCGTYRLYAKNVCNGDIPEMSQRSPIWDNKNERIVIDWHHPADRTPIDNDYTKFFNFCSLASHSLAAFAKR